VSKKYLVTSALPYANGPLHFGHLAGVYLPADIYCRHKKHLSQRVIHISGSDEHGVAIMLAAEKMGISYKEYVDQWNLSHRDLFEKYGIKFDFFGRTSSSYHKHEVLRWFKDLFEKGYIKKKPEQQQYCVSCLKFLPDRYVEGTCYTCGYKDARGDECPNCGEWIESLRLINPRCKICSSHNIETKQTEHWYLLLSKLETQFKNWFQTKKSWKPHVWSYTDALVESGLVDRAITRDLVWGIDVPLDDTQGKKLYVWFDAPIGYVSNTIEFLRLIKSNEDAFTDWWKNSDTEIIHFIGKDNIIFHALIWPCMALATEFVNPPSQIPASHFVNLEGKQFSKSTGWYVDSEKAINIFGQDALRAYLCSIIPETGDSTFSWDHFIKFNNELGNKIGNFINSTCAFLAKNWSDGLSAEAFSRASKASNLLIIQNSINDVTGALDSFQSQRALILLIHLGDVANETFHSREPWKMIKTDKGHAEETIALSLLFIATINALFRPFLPQFSQQLMKYFSGYLNDADLDKLYQGKLDVLTKAFKNGFKLPITPAPLFPRIDEDKVSELRVINSDYSKK
jgi:methionyl-tRNA synthetase